MGGISGAGICYTSCRSDCDYGVHEKEAGRCLASGLSSGFSAAGYPVGRAQGGIPFLGLRSGRIHCPAPKLSLFLEKYRHRLDEPAILGYYAHLYLDEHYVCRFWPKVLSFEDKNGCIQSKKDKITQVELKHSGEKVPFEKFFSPEYYYGDYTRCNHWFVEKFHIKPPEYRNMELLGMNEVQPEALKDVLEELEYLFSRGCIGDEKWMKVFDLAELEAFVRDTAEAFCRHMEDLMHM